MNALQKYTKRINENIFDTVRYLFLFRFVSFRFSRFSFLIPKQFHKKKKHQNASRGVFAYAKNVLS